MIVRDFIAEYRRMVGGMNTRAIPDKALTEAQLQAWVMEEARRAGWCAFHDYDSRGNPKGFPDTWLVRDDTLYAWELKNMVHQPTPEQREWLARLAQVTRVGAALYRPSDRDTMATLLNAPRGR